MTPYQLQLYCEIYNEKRREEFEDRWTIAWVQAKWTIQWLGKDKPPSIDKFLGKTEKQEQKESGMSDAAMFSIATQLNAAFGGKVIKREE